MKGRVELKKKKKKGDKSKGKSFLQVSVFKNDSESISVHHGWFQDGLTKAGRSYAHAASAEM